MNTTQTAPLKRQRSQSSIERFERIQQFRIQRQSLPEAQNIDGVALQKAAERELLGK